MKQAVIISLLLAFISCGVVNSENDPPPEGWFEIEVPLGEEENAYNIQDLYFLNRDVGWIVGRKTVEKGNRGYLGFTENGGKDWDITLIENYTELSSVYFFDRKEGVTAGRVTHFTTDGGKVWTHFLIPEGETPGGIFDITFGSSTNGWGVGPFGTVARSADRGKTWDYLDIGFKEERFVSAAALGHQLAWVITADTLLRTTDRGLNWQEVDLQNTVEAPPVRYQDITFINAHEGWVVGEFRRILHTEDGGESWELHYPRNDEQRNFDAFMSVSAYDSLNVLAVSSHGAILRTKDGGETWREQLPAKNEGGSFQSVQFVDADVAYAAGGALLMKTVTGGDSDPESE